jgi:hypothetical protein
MAVAAGIAGPVLPAGAVAPPLPSVLTLDSSNGVWKSSAGVSPTQLRAGRPDVYPLISGDDGLTAIWHLGQAIPQIAVAYNGTITRTVNNYLDDQTLIDVASSAPVAAVAQRDTSGGWLITVVDATTGTVTGQGALSLPLLDMFLSQTGHTLFILVATAPMRFMSCSIAGTLSCTTLAVLAGVPAASVSAAFPLWDHISQDGSTIAGVLDTGTASSSGHPQFDGFTITGLPSSPHVSDAGAGLTSGVGRFVGNNLYVAEQGHLLSYLAPLTFTAATATSDTAMTMTGFPSAIMPSGSAFNATFTAPTPFATSAKLLQLVGNTFSYPTSRTILISSTLGLFPGTTAPGWPYWYWGDQTSQMQYSYDKVTWTNFTPWPTTSFTVRRTVWLRSWHSLEINSLASSSGPILMSAEPVLSAVYRASTRVMYGLATVPDGTKILIQRRISANTWLTVFSNVNVIKWSYAHLLPAIVAQWRAVVLPTSQYIEAISGTVLS